MDEYEEGNYPLHDQVRRLDGRLVPRRLHKFRPPVIIHGAARAVVCIASRGRGCAAAWIQLE